MKLISSNHYPIFVDLSVYKGFESKLIVWTVNDLHIYRKLKDASVFGVITDLPQILTSGNELPQGGLLAMFVSMIIKILLKRD